MRGGWRGPGSSHHHGPVISLSAIRESLRSSLFAVPAVCVTLAVGAALGMVEVDRQLDNRLGDYTFGAGPDGAREVLSAITSSMITFTGLVFSITIVVLTLTSGQFSPRVLRTFLRDRVTQYSLGIYVATFTYSVLVLRTVRAGEDDAFVPALSTTVALLLLLVSIGMFITYIHHISTTIQVSSIIASIAAETRRTIEREAPAGEEPDSGVATNGGTSPTEDVPAGATPLRATGHGVLTTVDAAALVELACEADVVLVTSVAVGDFVPEGAPLVHVVGDVGRLDTDEVLGAFHLAKDRSMQMDVAFGFRQLVDIGEKALSPGINDPTTAVQVLDSVHDLLRRVATRRLPGGEHRDQAGRLRLRRPARGFAELLDVALEEIAAYGEDSIQVRRRLRALLLDLRSAARPAPPAAGESWLRGRSHRGEPRLRGSGGARGGPAAGYAAGGSWRPTARPRHLAAGAGRGPARAAPARPPGYGAAARRRAGAPRPGRTTRPRSRGRGC